MIKGDSLVSNYSVIFRRKPCKCSSRLSFILQLWPKTNSALSQEHTSLEEIRNQKSHKSQNDRYWNGFLGILEFNLLAKAGFPTSGCTRTCPDVFWKSPEKEALGRLFQCSGTLTVKTFFLMSRHNFLCSRFCSLPLVLLLGITENSSAPSSWHLLLRYL